MYVKNFDKMLTDKNFRSGTIGHRIGIYPVVAGAGDQLSDLKTIINPDRFVYDR